ncbi:MAG: cytochrome ubiquinol oxidase subunit I, partial [Candidatus Micrarchaeaceae archaeon]
MLPIIFDRATMGFALSVHIVLAVIGITLPVLIATYEYLAAKRDDNDYRVLARRLSVALVILFAAGTASGTLVAVNLLFLWPKFMALVSSVAILPVYIE